MNFNFQTKLNWEVVATFKLTFIDTLVDSLESIKMELSLEGLERLLLESTRNDGFNEPAWIVYLEVLSIGQPGNNGTIVFLVYS